MRTEETFSISPFPSKRTPGLLPNELLAMAGWFVLVDWLMVWFSRDLSVQFATAVPLLRLSTFPSPFISVASSHKARPGIEYLLIEVLAGLKVFTEPQTVPAELVALDV